MAKEREKYMSYFDYLKFSSFYFTNNNFYKNISMRIFFIRNQFLIQNVKRKQEKLQESEREREREKERVN